MKRFFIVFGLFITMFGPESAMSATTTSKTCPTGYITIVEKTFTVSNGACPAEYTALSFLSENYYNDTCLVASPKPTCFLYAKSDIDYTDQSGDYTFGTVCPLTAKKPS